MGILVCTLLRKIILLYSLSGILISWIFLENYSNVNAIEHNGLVSPCIQPLHEPMLSLCRHMAPLENNELTKLTLPEFPSSIGIALTLTDSIFSVQLLSDVCHRFVCLPSINSLWADIQQQTHPGNNGLGSFIVLFFSYGWLDRHCWVVVTLIQCNRPPSLQWYPRYITKFNISHHNTFSNCKHVVFTIHTM